MKAHKVSFEQIRTVLAAIALVEGWDGAHPSILNDFEDGSWITCNGKPEPSMKLLGAIHEQGYFCEPGR